MKVVVTGGAGFIGTNLCRVLGSADVGLRVIDHKTPDEYSLALLPPDTDAVVHLAANADVRGGWMHPAKDLKDNLLATAQLLETMRNQDIRRLVFASTGSVYHPSGHFHTPLCPTHATSLYAASKIASEQLIAAYCAAGFIDATILRFVSVLGPHCSHGLLVDFVRKLKSDAQDFEVIAPGTSEKSYIHVQDVADAIIRSLDPQRTRLWHLSDTANYEVFNVGTIETATPISIAQWTMDALGISKTIRLHGDTWVGDNPAIRLNIDELRVLGWEPQYGIEETVKETARWIAERS